MKGKDMFYVRLAAVSIVVSIVAACLWGISVYITQNFFCALSILCGAVFLYCSFRESYRITEEIYARGRK